MASNLFISFILEMLILAWGFTLLTTETKCINRYSFFASCLQFGMLIEFLFERFPNWEEVTETAIGDLQVGEKLQNLISLLTCLPFIVY